MKKNKKGTITEAFARQIKLRMWLMISPIVLLSILLMIYLLNQPLKVQEFKLLILILYGGSVINALFQYFEVKKLLREKALERF